MEKQYSHNFGSHNTSGAVSKEVLHGLSSGQGTGNLDSFNQKSQSIRLQMQVLNDKLFETEKLKSLNMQKKFCDRNQNFVRTSQDQKNYPLREQTSIANRSAEERKSQFDSKVNSDIGTGFSPHISSPYKENYKSRGEATIMRENGRAINRSQSSSQENCGTEKASAYRSINRLDDTIQKSSTNNKATIMTTEQTTQGHMTSGQLNNDKDSHRILPHQGPINDQLNQTCTESRIVQMGFGIGKYVENDASADQSPQRYNNSKTREVLSNIMQQNISKSDRNDHLNPIQERYRLQLGHHVIPETSLEVSISKQSKNTGSNQLENTRQGQIEAIRSGEKNKVIANIQDQEKSSKSSGIKGLQQSNEKPIATTKLSSQRADQNYNFLELHQISQHKGSEGHYYDNYKDQASNMLTHNNSKQSMLLDHKGVSDDQSYSHPYYKDSSNSGKIKQQQSLSPRRSSNRSQIGMIRQRSSTSNLTNHGKSEPISMEVETQRQTVISNFQQFNQERLQEMAALKQMSQNSINRIVTQNAPVFKKIEEQKLSQNYYDPFEQRNNEINDTCFFKEKPLDNTRSHDALFRSSNKLLNEVQEEIAQQPEVLDASHDFQKLDSGQVKILRKTKKKKTAITSTQSPTDGKKNYNRFLNMPNNIYKTQGLGQHRSLGNTQINRSISQVQNRSILGMLVGGVNQRFSSNKRESYKSVNQLYHNSQVLFSNKSRSRGRKNHDIIKDKIKLQNRDSQKSAYSEQNIHNSMNFADEPINLHNHLSSVQNFDNLPYSHSTSQNHLKKQPQRSLSINKNFSQESNSFHGDQFRSKSALIERASASPSGYEQPVTENVNMMQIPSEPKQSTNTWSNMNPSLPDQIHQKADGFIRLSNDNFNQYINRDDKGINNYNTQNILKTLQSSLLQTQGANTNSNNDPAKNLRNFFIQSSLTFNGNNLNTRQSKTKSISVNGASEEQKSLDRTYGMQSLQTENVVPQYLDEINEYDDQMDESNIIEDEPSEQFEAQHMPHKLNSHTQSGPDSYNNYRSLSQFQQTQSQSQSNQNLSRQHSQGQYYSIKPNFNMQSNTLQGNGSKDKNLYKKQFQTQQEQPHESTVNGGYPQTTSGFLSGGGMAGLQSAFGGGLDEFSIQNQGMRNDEMSYSQLPQQNEEILLAAFEPMSVFDLPSAIQEIQRSFTHIEELRSELIEKSRQNSDLQQNYQNLQNEAQNINDQVVNAQNQIDLNCDAIRALQEQNQFLSNLVHEKDNKIQELEENNNYLQNRDMSIQHNIEKLKAKYKQKLLEKEGEIGHMRVQTLQMQQQCHNYAEEIERIQQIMPQHQGASFGGKFTEVQNTDVSESPEVIQIDSQRETIANNKSPRQQPPINMHMEMNLSPMTKEIEKLRTYITTLVDNMAQNRGPSEDQKVISEIKAMLSTDNSDLKHKMKSYKDKMHSLQKQNDGLKLDNAKIIQKMHDLKKDVLELKLQNTESRNEAGKLQLDQISSYQTQAKGLEEQLMKEKLEKYQTALANKEQLIDLTSKYDRQLRDMRAALGLCFGMVDLNKHEVPQFLQGKLTKHVPSTISNEELEKSCGLFKKIFKRQTDTKNVDKVVIELQKENNRLKNDVVQEQRARRKLITELQEHRGNIRVICRVIPSKSRSSKRSIECINPHTLETNSYVNSNQRKKFKFDKVLDTDANQEDIFEEVQDLIESSMEGYNVCIMSYGQTGSGKTYTMVGDDKNPGLYFTAVDEIYNIIKEKQDRIQYEIQVSVIEIYNEQIKDLLQKDQNTNRVKLLEGSHGDMYGAQVMRTVTNKNQILKALRDACYNRSVGVTQFNEQSSRSHFIMTIFINGYDKQTRQVFHGKLSLVDLAGSERILRTNAEGIRIKEAQHINQSLATLGKVFLNLQTKSNHVPYRDSKLTHYLKDSIGGNAKTMMILQVRQNLKDHNESLGTLTFGQRAQRIRKGSITRARSTSTHSIKKKTVARSASACSGYQRKGVKVDQSIVSYGRLSGSLIKSKRKVSNSKKQLTKRSLSRSMVKLSNNNSIYKPILVQSNLNSRSHLDNLVNTQVHTYSSQELYRSESEESSKPTTTSQSLTHTLTQRSQGPEAQRYHGNVLNNTNNSVYCTKNISETEGKPYENPKSKFISSQNSATKFESGNKPFQKQKLLQELDQVHRLINDIDKKIEQQSYDKIKVNKF